MIVQLLLVVVACRSADPAEAVGEAAEASGAGEVRLSDAALANANLRVEPLGAVALSGQVSVPARLTLDPRKEARVSAVAPGTVDRIEVRPGDVVKAGQRLATVLSPDLGEAIGAHLSASARLQTASAKRDRTINLSKDGFASPSQLLDAESDLTVAAADAEAAEERVRVFGLDPEKVQPASGEHFSSRFGVRSPVDGEVLGIQATLGTLVDSGDPLFHVGNLDELWLLVGVYEKNLASIQVGSPVAFTVEAYGDELFTGTIDAIGNWLDPVTRTAEVRVLVPNTEHRLKPNMFANARLSVGPVEAGTGLVLPAAAVVTVEGRPSVFVELAPGRFRAVPVRTDLMADGALQVLAGVDEGARVVVDGAFTLASELGKSELEGE